jgi:hypothetical protein
LGCDRKPQIQVALAKPTPLELIEDFLGSSLSRCTYPRQRVPQISELFMLAATLAIAASFLAWALVSMV